MWAGFSTSNLTRVFCGHTLQFHTREKRLAEWSLRGLVYVCAPRLRAAFFQLCYHFPAAATEDDVPRSRKPFLGWRSACAHFSHDSWVIKRKQNSLNFNQCGLEAVRNWVRNLNLRLLALQCINHSVRVLVTKHIASCSVQWRVTLYLSMLSYTDSRVCHFVPPCLPMITHGRSTPWAIGVGNCPSKLKWRQEMKTQEAKFHSNVSGAYKHSVLTRGHLSFP